MDPLVEEHHMPSVEAVLAGTLALMTGYSQYLQAEANPAHRIGMGAKITDNLALLSGNPHLSVDCRRVLWQLHERWAVMASCTIDAASPGLMPHDDTMAVPASRTLQ